MNLRQLVILALVTLVACMSNDQPQLAITGTQLFAPLPGQGAGVAYFTIENNSRHTVQITAVRSPQFGRIEIHETTSTDGIARMRQLQAATVEPRSTLEFAPGGLHLMLMEAGNVVSTNSEVTLEIEIGDSILLVTAPLQLRHTMN